MTDIKNLQDLIEIVEKQEEMVALMETLQSENERLEQELSEKNQKIYGITTEMDKLKDLNVRLNSENRKLLSKLKELNGQGSN